MKKKIDTFPYSAKLYRLKTLFGLKFLQNPENITSPFYRSVLIECIISLHCIFKQNEFKEITEQVNFSDGIQTFIGKNRKKEGYNDIITLIKFFRDAVCHTEATDKRINDSQQSISFALQTGKLPKSNSGFPHLCEFDDDIACVFGNSVLYVNRHMERVFDDFFKKITTTTGFRWIPLKLSLT
jgi:hypothetical protein